MMRERIKWLLFPGVNLHSRLRYQILPEYFRTVGEEFCQVLDAGCGNGMLAYKSFLKGNAVTGISFNKSEAERCRQLFNEFLGISEDRLKFEVLNLYDIESLGQRYDEIICSEVIEHLVDDKKVCQSFYRLLKPGGVLHVCCPNAEHPYNINFPLDEEEKGGHVRAGYTLQSYAELLEPMGFRIVAHQGLGGPVRQAFNQRIKKLQERFGAIAGFPLFLISLPFLFLDQRTPRVPYSIYIKAVKSLE